MEPLWGNRVYRIATNLGKVLAFYWLENADTMDSYGVIERSGKYYLVSMYDTLFGSYGDPFSGRTVEEIGSQMLDGAEIRNTIQEMVSFLRAEHDEYQELVDSDESPDSYWQKDPRGAYGALAYMLENPEE